jgi:hypothetical protein
MTMRAPRLIIIVSSGVALALVVISLLGMRTRRETEEQLAEAIRRGEQMRTELARRERSAAPTPTATAAVTTPKPVAPPASPTAPESFPARIRPPGLMDFARNNPQLWNEFIESKRVELGRLHLPLLQRLGCSEEQQRRFKDIMAASIARGADIGAAADAQGLPYSDPAITALRKKSEEQQRAELLDLFGPAGFQQFDAFERALPVRGFVDGLAVQVAAIAPLSAAQADSLERALAEANEPYRKGGRADPQAVDWEKADARAKEILTPMQFAAWQLGIAHNMSGGSRRDQELKTIYDRTVQRMKATAAAP